MRKILLLVILVTSLITKTNAVPASPHPIKYTQPDGSVITIRFKGDEVISWAETMDGFKLLNNGKNGYEYATLNSAGDLQLSGILAHEGEKRTANEISLLKRVSKGVNYSQKQILKIKSSWDAAANGTDNLLQSDGMQKISRPQKVFSPKGTKKLLLILIDFTDKQFNNPSTAHDDFNGLLNTVNYTGHNAKGSVHDFFYETSYGNFDLTTDVVGPYHAANDMAYYGATGSNGAHDIDAKSLIKEAVLAADPDVNYADYANSDGTVEGVYVVYAGYGEATSHLTYTIWPHASSISTQTLDGVKVSRYSCSNELTAGGSELTTIGVICHEFGHVCGSPDFYDTDYEANGQFQGDGEWDVMDGGLYNGSPSGSQPAHFNPYIKTLFNWATPTELATSGTRTVADITTTPEIYKVNTKTPGEYFLIENRQQTGFNTTIPGHGLMIYRIGAGDYLTNKNTRHPQGFYPICASSTTAIPYNDPASYGDISSAGCPFPGSSGKKAFYDGGTPSTKSWAGVNTEMPITKITENADHTVSFTIQAATACTPDFTTQATAFTTSAIASSSMTVGWTRGGGDKVLVVARQGSAVDFNPLNGTSYTANTAFKSGDELGVGNFVVYDGTGTSVNITGLFSGTNYYFSIYEYDSSSHCYLVSPLTGSETTACPSTALPYTDNFERNVLGCWSAVDNTGQGNWQVGTTVNSPTPALIGNYAYFKSEYGVAHNYNADLISPTFDLSSYSNVVLKYNHLFEASSSNPSTGTVYYSIDNGVNWTSLATYTSDSSNPQAVTLAVDAVAGKSQVKFKWNYTCSPTGAYMWAVDDITVTSTDFPTVVTVPVTGLISTTAVSGGNVTSIGASALTAKGVCWSTSSIPTINDNVTNEIAIGTSTGAYRSSITGLTANTLYYVRAYATNASGTSYGVQATLVTPPIAMAATAVTTTGFTANWAASSNATGYSLDVSSTPFGNTALYENFNGFTTLASNGDQTSSLGSYLQNPGWSGSAVSAYSLGCINLNNSLSGQITTPTTDLSGNSGNYTAYIDVKQYDATATTMRVMHAADGINFTQVFNVPVSSAWVTQKVQISGGTSASKIKFATAGTASTRIYLDNIKIEVSDMLAGYNNLAVSGTSKAVTIPSEGVYYYRVRANGLSATSGNSNAIYTARQSVIIGGNWSSPSTWSDNVVPVATDNVLIASPGTVTVDVGPAICNDLTIQSGALLNIAPAKALTVNGTFTNNAGNTGFVLQSDAAGTATFLDNGITNTAVAATVQQYLPSVRNWYTSSPVSGFTAPAGNTYYKYIEAANDGTLWTSVPSGSAFDVMTGYIEKPDAAKTFTFSGALNTGSQSITGLTSAATAKTGFNLVGNPYPSYVNWMSAVKTNLSTTIWYRTQNSATTPAYVFDTYNETANTGTNNNGVAAVTGMIPPMQAFWIKVNAGSTGSLTFDNSMRSHQDVSTNKFRAPVANATQQILRLEVSNGTNSDEAIVLFNANATDGYDAYDSPKMTNANASIPEIYTFAGTEKAVINGLNSIATNKIIPLGFTTGSANVFSIKASQLSNFDADTKIVLKDNLLRVEQDITDGTPYNFKSNVTSTENRFSVVFKSKLSIAAIDNSSEKETIIVSKNANNQIIVISNTNYQTGVVTVSNAIGQKLHSTAITGVSTVVTKFFSPGVYLVTVNEGEKHVTKKVIIN